MSSVVHVTITITMASTWLVMLPAVAAQTSVGESSLDATKPTSCNNGTNANGSISEGGDGCDQNVVVANPSRGVTSAEKTALAYLGGSIVISSIAFVVFFPASYKMHLLYATFTTRWRIARWYVRFAPLLQWFSVSLPFVAVVLLALAIFAAAEEQWRVAVLGGPIAVAAFALTFGLARVATDAFAWSTAGLVLVGCGLFAVVCHFILFIAFVEPFSFIGTSIVLLCVSAVPSILLAYMSRPSLSTSALLKQIATGTRVAATGSGHCSTRRVSQAILLSLSICTLAVYCVAVLRLHPDASVRYVGLFVAAGVVVLDGMVWHLWNLGVVSSPLQTAILVVVARVAACIWGENFWLLGHSGVFIVAEVILVHVAVDEKLPKPDSPKRRRQVIADRLLDELDAKLRSGAKDSSDCSVPTGGVGGVKGDEMFTEGGATKPGLSTRLTRQRRPCWLDPSWITFALVLAFAFEISCTWALKATSVVKLTDVAACVSCTKWPQQAFALAGFAFTLLYALTLVVLRLAQRRVFEDGQPLLLVGKWLLLPVFVLWLGFACFISLLVDSWAVLVNVGFVPAVLGIFWEAYKQWVADDFKMKVPLAKSDRVFPADDSCAAAAEAGEAPTLVTTARADVVGIVGILRCNSGPWVTRAWGVDVVLLLAYALATHVVVVKEYRWIGWTATVGFLIAGMSFLSNRSWFGTFVFGMWQWLVWLLGCVVLGVWALGVWYFHHGLKVDYFAMALLLVVLTYPAVYSSLLAVQMLKDAKWELKDHITRRFVCGAFVVSLVLYLAFLGVLVGVGFVGEAICAVCGVAMVAVAVGVQWVYRGAGHFVPRRVKLMALSGMAFFVLCAGLILAAAEQSILLGFCVACGGAFLLLTFLAFSWYSDTKSLPGVNQLRVVSDIFFPAYRLGTSGKALDRATGDVVAAVGALLVAAIWGSVASAAIPKAPYVGVSVAVLALMAAFLLMCQLISEGNVLRARLLDDLPMRMLETAVRDALESVDGADVTVDGSVADAASMEDEAGVSSESEPEASDDGVKLMDANLLKELQAMLQKFAEARSVAKQSLETARVEANRGRFNPIPCVSMMHYFCICGEEMDDASASNVYAAQEELAAQAAAFRESARQRQRFVARLQLNLLAAEAQRRWSREAEFRAFLATCASDSSENATLTYEDFTCLPVYERNKLEQAWALWRKMEATRVALTARKQREEEEAQRRRAEAMRKVQKQARSKLCDAIASMDLKALVAALENASSCGIWSSDPDVEKAQMLVDEIKDAQKQLEDALSGVTDGGTSTGVKILEEAIAHAKMVGITDELIGRAQQILDRFREEQEFEQLRLTEAMERLRTAMGAGKIGELEDAVIAAKGASDSDLADAQVRLKELRAARDGLQVVLRSSDVDAIQEALSVAHEAGLESPEVGKAEHILDEHHKSGHASREQERARVSLVAACSGGSISGIQIALDHGETVGLPRGELRVARERLKKLKGLVRLLEEATSARSMKDLVSRLSAAKVAGLKDPAVEKATTVLRQVADEEKRKAKEEEDERRRKQSAEITRKREEELRRKREEELERRRKQEAEARKSGGRVEQKVDRTKLLASVTEGGHFVDVDFKPSQALHAKSYEWQRLSKLSTPKLEVDGFNPEDVRQGELGDCWLLSAMSCCASKRDLIEKVFSYSDEKVGIYVVRIYHGGVFREVAVDDLVPTKYGQCSFATSRTSEQEVWVTMLEKAYAKVHGSYDAIVGGQVTEGLVAFTGGIGNSTDLQGKQALADISSGALWSKIEGFHKDGHLLGCGSHSGSDTDINAKGIVQGHAYSLLRVAEVDGNRLLQLRNPWGKSEWKGKWSDKDTKSWTQRMRKKLDFKAGDDGIFWMAFEDFVLHYSTLYVCRVLTSDWNIKVIASEWKGKTAGGCANFPSFKNNPVFRLQVKGRVRLNVVLEQGTEREHLFYIGFKIYSAVGKRRGASVAGSGSLTNRTEVCIEQELEETATPYYLIASTFDPGNEADFWIKACWRGDESAVTLTAE
eukprot:TRINITY_DN23525_c0_g2_i1.p1 TRINITY_DN23525_c0_g2~~TRINITY_DN23525_c0_g2_i1.p1  ORF type:complete len:2086 (-),score=383.67 TRINITY_DN23525_c0_g2_i1:300-6338(-)